MRNLQHGFKKTQWYIAAEQEARKINLKVYTQEKNKFKMSAIPYLTDIANSISWKPAMSKCIYHCGLLPMDYWYGGGMLEY